MTAAICRLCGYDFYARNVRNPKTLCYICNKEYENAARAGRVIVNGFNWTHSYLYFAYSPTSELVKIGGTLLPEPRIRQVRKENKDQTITYIGFLAGDQQSESQIHKRFKASRERGEWFRAEACLLSFILRNAHTLAYIRSVYQVAWAAAKYQYYADYGTTNSHIADAESAVVRIAPPNAFSDAAYLRTGLLPARVTPIAMPSVEPLLEAA